MYSSYSPSSNGNSHVVYTSSSLGKTTASQAFLTEMLPTIDNSRGLMITSTLSESYLTHLATVLGIQEEEKVLYSLVTALRTVKPSPASVLILDEFNSFGKDNCNIKLVDILMRFIYQHDCGIGLYVVSQNAEVASALCSLDAWQKIGPLAGLTSPTRMDVISGTVKWHACTIYWRVHAELIWSVEQLTRPVESRYTDVDFEKDWKRCVQLS